MYSLLSSEIPDNIRNRRMLDMIKKAAEEYEKHNIAELPFSKYRIYFENGSRVEYEACYIEHRRRLNVYTAMVMSSGEEKWRKGLEDILWAICNEYTWAFPAHIKDWTNLLESKNTIDLFASETGHALTECCHLVGDKISPIVKHRVEQEVRARIIEPYKEKKVSFHKNNWSAVCVGSIGMTVLYLGGLDEYMQIDKNVMESMNDFLDSYQDDGCCLEGALYWGYGFGYFCYFASMLRDYTQGKRNLFELEKVKQIALFRQKIYLENNVVIPFADSPHNYSYHIGLLHFLAKEYSEVEVPDDKYGIWFGDDIRHRFADFIRDFNWYDPQLKTRKVCQSKTIFKASQWYIERKENFTFAVKGGRNNEPHNHNDIGHFIIYSNKNFILDDLGWPEYDKEYFGEKRYDNLCAASSGHSVPMINGIEQVKGQEHKAEWIEQGDNHVCFDLTKAYPVGCCKRMIRSFSVLEQGILLNDIAEKITGTIRERFVTRIQPIIEKNKVMIADWTITCSYPEVQIQMKEQTFEPRLSICKMNMKPLETAYLIDFVIEPKSDKIDITIEIMKQ